MSSAGLADREKAVEKQWASQEDEKLLRRLLGKIRASASASAPTDEQRKLDAIVDKYKVSHEDKAALLAWRHSAEH